MRSLYIKRLSVTAIFAAALCSLLLVPGVYAQFVVDELGNGTNLATGLSLPFGLAPDPGPGGFPLALTYTLPFAGVVGDVVLSDPTQQSSDCIRFNGNGTLVFYSNNQPDGAEPGNLADVGFPAPLYANVVFIAEIGPEGNNGATYTPLAGMPGFDPSGPTYTFISDVPEPGTVMLVGVGLVGLLAISRRKK